MKKQNFFLNPKKNFKVLTEKKDEEFVLGSSSLRFSQNNYRPQSYQQNKIEFSDNYKNNQPNFLTPIERRTYDQYPNPTVFSKISTIQKNRKSS